MAEIPQPQLNVFVDTNVVLDFLLKRQPFYGESSAIFKLVDLEKIRGYLSADSVTTIFYFIHKKWRDNKVVYQEMDELIDDYTVAAVTEKTITDALALRWKDFEDAVQYMSATEAGVDCIVTRNTADYKASAIPCMSPADFITYFSERQTT